MAAADRQQTAMAPSAAQGAAAKPAPLAYRKQHGKPGQAGKKPVSLPVFAPADVSRPFGNCSYLPRVLALALSGCTRPSGLGSGWQIAQFFLIRGMIRYSCRALSDISPSSTVPDPQTAYRNLVADGELHRDPVQAVAVEKLQSLWHALLKYEPESGGGWRERFG